MATIEELESDLRDAVELMNMKHGDLASRCKDAEKFLTESENERFELLRLLEEVSNFLSTCFTPSGRHLELMNKIDQLLAKAKSR